MNTIITIGRQYGSGGRKIGMELAQRYGIPFYDKELLKATAEKSGLCDKIMENFDERPKSLLYSIALDSYFSLPGGGAGDSLEHQVYLAMFNTIRHLADEGPCVIIGRCADYALAGRDNVLSVFVHAPLDMRIKTVMARHDLTEDKARARIAKTDKRRAAYYEYYSTQRWGDVNSYDYCLDSSVLGIHGTVDLIGQIVAMKEARQAAQKDPEAQTEEK